MASDARAVTGRRIVALVSLIAAAVLFVHGLLWDAVRYHDGRFVAHPAELVGIGTDKASLFRLALVADMFGDYLLFVPAIVYLWRSLRTRGGMFVDVISVAGVTFAVGGALGAAVLATAGEPLIRAYARASPDAAAEIAVVFGALIHAVTGVWQLSGGILLGVWLVGIGTSLRPQWRWFARFSLAVGVVALVGAGGLIIGLDYDSDAPASPAFFPLVVWIAWFGVLSWTRPAPRPIAASDAVIC